MRCPSRFRIQSGSTRRSPPKTCYPSRCQIPKRYRQRQTRRRSPIPKRQSSRKEDPPKLRSRIAKQENVRPHFGSPDKVPAVRLRTIEDAGRLAIPFTTGILVGIGETAAERAAPLLAIRDLHRRYRHVQEVIVQNFRAKPGTAMHAAPEPREEEFLAAVATTRVVFGPRMHVQAPPNLSDPDQRSRLLDAGIDDWGGVSPLTPDHVNPERPWPAIEALSAGTAERGLELRERLTIYPEFARRPDPFLAGKMRAPVAALEPSSITRIWRPAGAGCSSETTRPIACSSFRPTRASSNGKRWCEPECALSRMHKERAQSGRKAIVAGSLRRSLR